MKKWNHWRICSPSRLAVMALVSLLTWATACQADLAQVKQNGVLRHLGVPYAHFVTGSGDGLDAELMQLFARHLGVRYQYVSTSWKDVIGDLTGKHFSFPDGKLEILGELPIRGDVIANGMTILPHRAQMVDYSTPTFPTQVWLIARGDSTMQPIQPSNDIDVDIKTVKSLINGRQVLGMANTCLDPSLYNLQSTGADLKSFHGTLNEVAPAIINGEAETTLLDVPDAMIALEKWPGKIKVIGPISPRQKMACAFAKESPELLQSFNQFLEQCKRDGTYLRLVKKYYPAVTYYFPEFFENFKATETAKSLLE